MINEKKLKFRYVIARFMPDQIRGEFVNIGILLHIPATGLLLNRWLPGLDRMQCLSPAITFDQYVYFRNELKSRYIAPAYSQESLFDADNLTRSPFNNRSPEFLDKLNAEMSVPFGFSTPFSGLTQDPQDEIDYLYDQLVAPKNDDRREREKDPLPTMRRKIATEFKEKNLLVGNAIQKDVLITGKAGSWPFDFGRENGEVIVVQAISLHQRSASDKAKTAFIFNGHVEDVRKAGKIIKPYVVIHESNDFDKQEGLDAAKNLIKNNDTEIVSESEISALSKDLMRFLHIKQIHIPSVK